MDSVSIAPAIPRVRHICRAWHFHCVSALVPQQPNMDSTVEEIPPSPLKPWKTWGGGFPPLFWAHRQARAPTKPHQSPTKAPKTISYPLQNVKLNRPYGFRKGDYGMDETENAFGRG
jgi:hypothetical protein